LRLLQIFQPQFQLFNLPLQFLGLAAELHPPELAEQQFQSFDLTIPLPQLLLSGNPFLVFRQQESAAGHPSAEEDDYSSTTVERFSTEKARSADVRQTPRRSLKIQQ